MNRANGNCHQSNRRCLGSNMASYTYHEVPDQHFINRAVNCNGRKAVPKYKRNMFGMIERCHANHSLTLCIDDCEKPACSRCTSRTLVAPEQLRQFLQKKFRKRFPRTGDHSFIKYNSWISRHPYPQPTIWCFIRDDRLHFFFIYYASEH